MEEWSGGAHTATRTTVPRQRRDVQANRSNAPAHAILTKTKTNTKEVMCVCVCDFAEDRTRNSRFGS